MTDIKARLDEIAKEAAELNYSYRNERVIRTAINQALEMVLTAEPSEEMLILGQEKIMCCRFNKEVIEDCKHADEGYRAMSSALLEELKK